MLVTVKAEQLLYSVHVRYEVIQLCLLLCDLYSRLVFFQTHGMIEANGRDKTEKEEDKNGG